MNRAGRLLLLARGQTLAALGACLLLVATAWAQTLPPWFPLPPGTVVSGVLEEAFGEVEIPLAGRNPPNNILRGRTWTGAMDVVPLGLKPDASPREVFARLREGLLRVGWEVVQVDNEGTTLRRRRDGRDAWARVGGGDAADVRWAIVEIGVQTRRHVLAAPAATPEVLKDVLAPIPYLTPLPEFKAGGGGAEDQPMLAVLDATGQPQVLAPSMVHRDYGGPEPHVSPLQFAAIYEAALVAAGWKIVQIDRGGFGAQGAGILARYQRGGRDIWARLSGGGDSFRFTVGDAGADDLGARLRRDCRAPLHGLFFDFDKATLRPDSEPALQRARAALLAAAPQAFEVQGHTDNVGQDAYNQKLSEARAGSVMAWLTGQGIAAARLSARGLGRVQPVATNDTDEGRARNRRVELVCRR